MSLFYYIPSFMISFSEIREVIDALKGGILSLVYFLPSFLWVICLVYIVVSIAYLIVGRG